MFSVIFPGQGSQSVGMAKNLYNNYRFIKELFDKADEILGFSLSKIILEGPKEKLRSEEHTSELQSRTNLVCRLLLEKKKI